MGDGFVSRDRLAGRKTEEGKGKMFEKVRGAVVAVFLLTVTLQAGHLQALSGDGATICDWTTIGLPIPVMMGVELCVEILDQEELAKGLMIHQIGATDDWTGSMAVRAKASCSYGLCCNVELTDAAMAIWDKQGKESKKLCWLDPESGDATFCETVNEHQLHVRLDNLSVVHFAPKQTIQVATVQLTVAPKPLTVKGILRP
jgi:hypothetical protein